MTLPTEVYTFVITEFLQSKGVLPTLIGKEGIYYRSKDGESIKISADQFKIPIELVQDILQKLDYPIHEFKVFCEHFIQSKEFEDGLNQTLPTED